MREQSKSEEYFEFVLDVVLDEEVVLPLALDLQSALHLQPPQAFPLVLLPCAFVDFLVACEDAESLSFPVFHFSLVAASLLIETLAVEFRFALA